MEKVEKMRRSKNKKKGKIKSDSVNGGKTNQTCERWKNGRRGRVRNRKEKGETMGRAGGKETAENKYRETKG